MPGISAGPPPGARVGLAQPLDHGLGVGRRGVRQQDEELLAAPAGQLVGLAQAAAHGAGEVLQHAVAHLVAELVVDALEVVQVQQRQAQRAGLAALAGQGLGQALDHVVAVVQPGELVAPGHLLQPVHRGLQRGLLLDQPRAQAGDLHRRGQHHRQDAQGQAQRDDLFLQREALGLQQLHGHAGGDKGADGGPADAPHPPRRDGQHHEHQLHAEDQQQPGARKAAHGIGQQRGAGGDADLRDHQRLVAQPPGPRAALHRPRQHVQHDEVGRHQVALPGLPGAGPYRQLARRHAGHVHHRGQVEHAQPALLPFLTAQQQHAQACAPARGGWGWGGMRLGRRRSDHPASYRQGPCALQRRGRCHRGG